MVKDNVAVEVVQQVLVGFVGVEIIRKVPTEIGTFMHLILEPMRDEGIHGLHKTCAGFTGGLAADSAVVLGQLFDRVLEVVPRHEPACRMQRVFDVNIVAFAGDLADQHPVDAITLPGVDELAFGMCHLKSFWMRWASLSWFASKT